MFNKCVFRKPGSDRETPPIKAYHGAFVEGKTWAVELFGVCLRNLFPGSLPLLNRYPLILSKEKCLKCSCYFRVVADKAPEAYISLEAELH